MNNIAIILISLLILSAFSESKPRRHKYSHRYETQWSQDNEEENEYDDRSSNRMGPRPPVNSKMDTNSDDNDLEGEVITRNLPYPRPFQPDLEQSYGGFGGYGSGGYGSGGYGSGGSGRTNNQRPRPSVEDAQGSNRGNRVPYNNFEKRYNGQRSYEMGDFGNGHHNLNTFNIHKKIIYIN